MQLDGDLFLGHRPTDGMQQARAEKRRLIWGVGLVVALVAWTAFGPAHANVDWTILDENGHWVDNPDCKQPECGPELPAKPDQRGDDPAPEWHKEIHNGFSCAYAGNWVAHPAARPVMTPEHIAASHKEALDRQARLGDRAKDMVCKPWQVRAGFVIVGRL